MTAVSRSQLAYSAEPEAIPSLAAFLNNKHYPVKDISSGGISLENVDGEFTVGKKLPLIVRLQSDALSLDVALQAEVQHFDHAKGSLGCRFVNLTSDHIALLNQILKSLVTN